MGRYYKYKGWELPSVTTVTGILDKPALMPWAAKMAIEYVIDNLPTTAPYKAEDLFPILEAARTNFRKASRKAMDTGSRVHHAIEDYLKTGNEPFKPSPEVEAAFLAFLEWKDEYKLEPLEMEKTVYGSNFAGTTDLVCLLNKKKYVIDYKTSTPPKSKKAYPEARLQIAAYRHCIEGVEGCGVLYLDKLTGMPFWADTSDTYEDDWKAFDLLCQFYWHFSAPKKIKNQKEAA